MSDADVRDGYSWTSLLCSQAGVPLTSTLYLEIIVAIYLSSDYDGRRGDGSSEGQEPAAGCLRRSAWFL